MKRQLFISSSYYAHRYVDCDTATYYSQASDYIEAQCRFQERYKTDVIPGPIYLAGEAYQFGTTTKIQEETGPIVSGYAYEIKGYVEDRSPNFKDAYYDYMFKCFSGLRSEFPEKTLIGMILAPVDYGIIVFGMQRWIEMLLFEKNLYFSWLDRFVSYHNRYKELLVEAGADLLAVTNILMNNRIIPDRLIKEDLIPYMNKHLSSVVPTLVHSSFMPMTENIRHMEQIKTTLGYVLNSGDDLKSIRSLLTSEKLLIGSLGSDFIFKKTPETLMNASYNALKAMEGYEKFILGTTGADLNRLTTKEQVNAIYRGMERYEKEREINQSNKS